MKVAPPSAILQDTSELDSYTWQRASLRAQAVLRDWAQDINLPEDRIALPAPADFAVTASRGFWKPAQHLLCLSRKLEAFVRAVEIAEAEKSQGPRLIINAPPRRGKSILIDQYFLPWVMMNHPEWPIMLLTYQDRFAASWGRKARNVFTQMAKVRAGLEIDPEVRGASGWGIKGHRGEMHSYGMRGAVAGHGAKIGVLDDLIKNIVEAQSEAVREQIWELFQSFMTRLEPGAGVLIAMHRWHKKDLMGRLQTEAIEAGEPFAWDVVEMPDIAEDNPRDPTLLTDAGEDEAEFRYRKPGDALWPELWPLESLERKRAATARVIWEALHQQRPRDPMFSEWPDSMFEGQWVDEWVPGCKAYRVMYLDPSKGAKDKGADYSAFVMLGTDGSGNYCVEADLERRPVEKIVNDGTRLMRRFLPMRFKVEGNSLQDELFLPRFKNRCEEQNILCPIFTEQHTDDKVCRILQTVDPYLCSRKVRFVRTPGTRLLVDQLTEFPNGDHNDGPDALEGAFSMLKTMMIKPSNRLTADPSSVAAILPKHW